MKHQELRKVKSYHFMTLYNYIISTRLLLFVLYTLNRTECKIEATLICLHIYTDLISMVDIHIMLK